MRYRLAHSARYLLAVAAASATVLTAAVPSASAATSGSTSRTWASGVFAGYGPQNDLAFATWRGSPIQTGTDVLTDTNWSTIENPAWRISTWSQAPSVTPTFTVPMFPASGGSLAESASGADNAHFVTLARNMVAGGLGKATIRLGWEFNGTWYGWSVTNQAAAAQYVAAWRQIVTAMRSVPGANFHFDWCATVGQSAVSPALSYPGDAYVDYVGEDVYDWNRRAGAETADQRWSDIVNLGNGLAWQAQFAGQHHKQVSFPEWGLISSTVTPARGGGDDPAFVQHMYQWFASHNTAYENYFDVDSPTWGTYSGLNTGNGMFPKSVALYEALYGPASYAQRPTGEHGMKQTATALTP